MKTDRELLELAAKAGVYSVCWHHANQCHMITEGATERKWNPLTDDGDALRLAVKLSIDIEFFKWSGEVRATDYGASRDEAIFAEEPYGEDINLATRRAITRAAAEIGEQMP